MTFYAFYEDAAKVEAAAKARGFTGNDGESWHDFVEAEHNRFRTEKQFAQLDAAIDWLKGEVSRTKTVFGCGTVLEQQRVAPRCAACVCQGVQTIREYTVSDEGVEADYQPDSLCLDD